MFRRVPQSFPEIFRVQLSQADKKWNSNYKPSIFGYTGKIGILPPRATCNDLFILQNGIYVDSNTLYIHSISVLSVVKSYNKPCKTQMKLDKKF